MPERTQDDGDKSCAGEEAGNEPRPEAAGDVSHEVESSEEKLGAEELLGDVAGDLQLANWSLGGCGRGNGGAVGRG